MIKLYGVTRFVKTSGLADVTKQSSWGPPGIRQKHKTKLETKTLRCSKMQSDQNASDQRSILIASSSINRNVVDHPVGVWFLIQYPATIKAERAGEKNARSKFEALATVSAHVPGQPEFP